MPTDLDGLHQVAMHSSDLERSRAFYEETLGLPFLAQYEPPGLLFFDLGPTRLLLKEGAGKGVLYLRVGDIEDACIVLKERGVAFTSDPHLIFKDDAGTFGPAGEEEWMAFFEDPDGNTLALATRKLPSK